MIKVKKKMSFGIILCFMILLFSNCSFVNAEEVSAEVAFVGIEHSPLVVGDKETFFITSKNADMVQYRVFINKEDTDEWEDLTQGYTEVVQAKVPYVVEVPKTFELGKYKISVWVKKAGTSGIISNEKGGYDSFYIAGLNCVERDDDNRVYAEGDLDLPKSSYTIGEKVIINGIKDISGMKSPYKYKLHIFQPEKADSSNSGWVKDVTEYSDSIEWVPQEAGTYVLDVWVTSEDSEAAYEAWKLKTITVSENVKTNETIKNSKDITLKNDGETFGGTNENDMKNIDGDIYVTGNNVKLQYLNVNGTIFINSEATGTVSIKNVKAKNIKIISNSNHI